MLSPCFSRFPLSSQSSWHMWPLGAGTWVCVQSPLPLPSSPSCMPQQKWRAENVLKARYFCILYLCLFFTWYLLAIPSCSWLSLPIRTSKDITLYRWPYCSNAGFKEAPFLCAYKHGMRIYITAFFTLYYLLCNWLFLYNDLFPLLILDSHCCSYHLWTICM